MNLKTPNSAEAAVPASRSTPSFPGNQDKKEQAGAETPDVLTSLPSQGSILRAFSGRQGSVTPVMLLPWDSSRASKMGSGPVWPMHRFGFAGHTTAHARRIQASAAKLCHKGSCTDKKLNATTPQQQQHNHLVHISGSRAFNSLIGSCHRSE